MHSSSLSITSCHIIEKTFKGLEFNWIWSFPYISIENRLNYTRKINILTKDNKFIFNYFHLNKEWIYFTTNYNVTKSIEVVAVILCTNDYNPERYKKLLQLFMQNYVQFQKPQKILELFLSVLTIEKCKHSSAGEVFHFHEYDQIDYNINPKLRGVIQSFEMDVILIYTALLLKQRIFVYHHDVNSLVNFVVNLPAFVEHRVKQNIWNHIFPFIENCESELAELKELNYYIVGSIDPNFSNSIELYDIYINIPAAEITVAPSSREKMTMTKVHKDIALFMIQLVEKKDLTERDMFQEISRKTKELIENLRLITKEEQGRTVLSLQSLRAKEHSSQLENFLVLLAKSENFIITE